MISMKSTLNLLKNQSLQTILDNIKVKFEYVKNDISQAIKSDSLNFESLLNIYNFRHDIVSSSQVSAIYLLGYLDFYSLYTIAFANYTIFENLQSATLNKYLYIFSLYEQMFSIIASKKLDKESIHSLYINFRNPSLIDIPASQYLVSAKSNIGVLKYKDILTLPVNYTKDITPKTVYISDDDKSIHSTINNTRLDNIDYTIARKQFNKISLLSNIVPLKPAISYALIPEVSGTVYGYIGDKIFFIIDDIIKNTDGPVIIMAKSSTNNTQWSDPYQIYFDQASDIMIENNEKCGMKIIFSSGNALAKQDSWKITLKSVRISDPSILAKIDFGVMSQISYIRCSDVSRYPLTVNNIKYRDTRYSEYITSQDSFVDELDLIIPIHSKIDTLMISATQNEPYESNINGSFCYNYDFKLEDIHAVINEYESSGSISFNKESVTNINSVRLGMDYLITNENTYNEDGMIQQKMFIENSIFIYNDLDKLEIPVLYENARDKIAEMISPYKVDTGLIASIKTRFPIDKTEPIKVYNIHTRESFYVDIIDIVEEFILIHDFQASQTYIIEYTIKESSSDNISFIQNKNISYGYYKDINNRHCLAIRSGNFTTAFTGDYSFAISMESIELPYMSPIIYEYSLLFN